MNQLCSPPIRPSLLLGLLLLHQANAAQLEVFEFGGFVHDSSGLVAQFDGLSPEFFSTLDSENLGSFGWSFTNTTGSTLSSVSFFGFLDAQIDDPLNTYFNEFGEFVSLALPPAAPPGAIPASTWEIDEPGFLFGDIFDNLLAGALDGTNAIPVGLPDDVSLALGFVVGDIAPSDALTATFVLSQTDIGGLRHVDPDSDFAVLLNGSVAIQHSAPPPNPVPEPSSLLLTTSILAVGLALRRNARR